MAQLAGLRGGFGDGAGHPGAFVGLQYDSILTRLIQERLAVIAETTASSFRTVIGLGLSVAAVRNASDVLAAARPARTS